MEWGRAHLETALEALENLPVFVAYNANVDAIVRANDALEAALDRPQSPGENRAQGRLDTPSDLATAITHAMAAGRGDELTLTDEFAATLEARGLSDVSVIRSLDTSHRLRFQAITQLATSYCDCLYLPLEQWTEVIHKPYLNGCSDTQL